MFKIYNSLTGRKEPFEPLVPGRVGMYVCGVTVYDVCHIGHARSALVFDVIRRYLEHMGFRVTYVRNFTDIDDKIIARAQREGIDWKEIAEKYIKDYQDDMKLLGVRKAEIEPRATDHIDEMKEMIDGLMNKGYAYRTNGDVYFRVKNFDGYGKLSRRDTEDMLAGARLEIDEKKEDPLDFGLWKDSKSGEPSWSSPWGSGRPGWHIECSAMAIKYLGATFDIHGGGRDLIFPHHENEIAQGEAYTGGQFSRYWIHNGFVNVNQEKMSKSLGNFFTIREVFEQYPYSPGVTAEVLRYFLISNHYRSPVDFSDQALDSAHSALDNFYSMLQKLAEAKHVNEGSVQGDAAIRDALLECGREFRESMDDDLNTAAAIGSLHRFRKQANMCIDKGFSVKTAVEVEDLFKKYGNILGLFSFEPDKWEFSKELSINVQEDIAIRDSDNTHLPEAELFRLIAEREEARKRSDWRKADGIRDRFLQEGIILEDRPDGSTRIKR